MPSRAVQRADLNLVSHHSGKRIANENCNALYVAVLVNGLAVFIGIQIDREIDWLGANCTRC
jgi:hypothetical protein